MLAAQYDDDDDDDIFSKGIIPKVKLRVWLEYETAF